MRGTLTLCNTHIIISNIIWLFVLFPLLKPATPPRNRDLISVHSTSVKLIILQPQAHRCRRVITVVQPISLPAPENTDSSWPILDVFESIQIFSDRSAKWYPTIDRFEVFLLDLVLHLRHQVQIGLQSLRIRIVTHKSSRV